MADTELAICQLDVDDASAGLILSTEAHALKRPFDAPARADKAVQKFVMGVNGIEQPRPGLGARDGVDQSQRLVGAIGQQRTNMPRGATAPDQRDSVTIRHDARTRTAAEL